MEADSTLQGVTAVSDSDVWAVGSFNPYSETFTLTEHWNGSQWSIVPSPSPNTFISELRSVSAVASNDVWAVGDILNYQTNFEDMLIEHWNGSTWQTVSHTSPCAPNLCGRLYNVFALSGSDIWAVGVNITSYDIAVIMHWNGANWSVSSNPPLRSICFRYGLLGVSATSATHALATGYCQQSGDTTLTETLGPPQFPMKGPGRR